eukprot:TRINITY_DN4371_c0_g1_i1.p1 TRINITY_DN4371_c0_g1~~TRINITY_DN4371_c0_g1_i1.p1  ORF type:complete len:73 (+),score=1.25 TRINITY_DN4371_c0_g1_i1:45-263(+)
MNERAAVPLSPSTMEECCDGLVRACAQCWRIKLQTRQHSGGLLIVPVEKRHCSQWGRRNRLARLELSISNYS